MVKNKISLSYMCTMFVWRSNEYFQKQCKVKQKHCLYVWTHTELFWRQCQNRLKLDYNKSIHGSIWDAFTVLVCCIVSYYTVVFWLYTIVLPLYAVHFSLRWSYFDKPFPTYNTYGALTKKCDDRQTDRQTGQSNH